MEQGARAPSHDPHTHHAHHPAGGEALGGLVRQGRGRGPPHRPYGQPRDGRDGRDGGGGGDGNGYSDNHGRASSSYYPGPGWSRHDGRGEW